MNTNELKYTDTIDKLDEVEVKNRNISGVSTTVAIAILVLLMFLVTIKLPEKPKPIEEMGGGVAVSLGDPDAGGPNEVPVEAAYTPPSAPAFEEEAMTEQTHDEEAVAMPKTPDKPKTTTTKPTNTNTPTPPTKTKEQLEEEALQKKMADNAKKNAANGGNGTKPGVGGSPDGVKGGKPDGQGSGTTGSGKGKGDGNGEDGFGNKDKGKASYKHSLGSRKITNFQYSNDEDCNAEGRVIVDIMVKPDGTVKPLKISPSSTNTNQCLNKLAMKIAGKSKFAASDNDVTVEGTITIYFEF